MLLQTNAVTQDGSPRKWAGRVHSDNTNGFFLLAGVGGKFIGDGTFAGSRRASDTHAVPCAKCRIDAFHEGRNIRAVPFNV
jgi:hypothetical protein